MPLNARDFQNLKTAIELKDAKDEVDQYLHPELTNPRTGLPGIGGVNQSQHRKLPIPIVDQSGKPFAYMAMPGSTQTLYLRETPPDGSVIEYIDEQQQHHYALVTHLPSSGTPGIFTRTVNKTYIDQLESQGRKFPKKYKLDSKSAGKYSGELPKPNPTGKEPIFTKGEIIIGSLVIVIFITAVIVYVVQIM